MVCKSQEKNKQKWNQAIEDAKDTISKCERKIESMKLAIKILQQSRDENAVYPGTLGQFGSQDSEQQHSV